MQQVASKSVGVRLEVVPSRSAQQTCRPRRSAVVLAAHQHERQLSQMTAAAAAALLLASVRSAARGCSDHSSALHVQALLPELLCSAALWDSVSLKRTDILLVSHVRPVYYLDLLLLVAQVAQDGFSLQPVYRASDPACIYKQAQPATAGPGPTLFESNEKAVQELQVRSAQSDHSV